MSLILLIGLLNSEASTVPSLQPNAAPISVAPRDIQQVAIDVITGRPTTTSGLTAETSETRGPGDHQTQIARRISGDIARYPHAGGKAVPLGDLQWRIAHAITGPE